MLARTFFLTYLVMEGFYLMRVINEPGAQLGINTLKKSHHAILMYIGVGDV
jgi:hypothetical protein